MSSCTRQSSCLLCGCLVLLALLSGGLPLATGEAATTLVVTSLADPGTGGCAPAPAECTLREAIAAAQDGDTITFDPALFASGVATVTLTAGELVIRHDVTITGPGRHLLWISGNQASRVFRIRAGAVASIEKVTIILGLEPSEGGGISNAGTLTLVRSTVSFNTASGNTGHSGGGISNTGTLTLMESWVLRNTDTRGGGGLSNYGGTVTLVRSTVFGNEGGGLFNDDGGTLTLVRSTVSFNTARGGGGGGLYNRGALTLRHSTVSDNRAGHGGGLYNARGRLRLVQSTVRANIATSVFYPPGVSLVANGGGIVIDRGTVTLIQSTVSGNLADRAGGIMNSGTLTLQQSTVSGNFAVDGPSAFGGDGGGLWNSGTLTLRQSTVSGNFAGNGGGGIVNLNDGTLTLHTTIVAGNTTATHYRSNDCGQGGTMENQGHNLTGAGTGCPSDPSLGDVTVRPRTVFTTVLGLLQDNGGPTFTHALLPGSPAVDAGDSTQCSGTDQRGVVRPQGAGCDIGAFELEVP